MKNGIIYTNDSGNEKKGLLFRKSLLKTIVNHSIWWMAFVIYELFIFYYTSGSIGYIPKNLLYYAINITLFYSHYYILNITLSGTTRKYIHLTIYIIAEMTFFLLIKVAADVYFTDFSKITLTKWHIVKGMAALDLYRIIFFAGLSSLYWTALNISRFEKKAIEAEVKQLTVARDKLVIEANLARSQNALLRQQINPHLLFNSLNFIHSTVHKVSEEAAENVILLAEIMRFSIERPGDDDKILLEDEVEQLRNLIRINQVRFEWMTAVDFQVTGETTGCRIIPLVLMTLAENVFKHGDLTVYPAVIILHVDKTGRLRFYTKNRVKAQTPFPRLRSTGLENIGIRLDFAYGNAYRLNLTENDNFFEAELLIL